MSRLRRYRVVRSRPPAGSARVVYCDSPTSASSKARFYAASDQAMVMVEQWRGGRWVIGELISDPVKEVGA